MLDIFFAMLAAGINSAGSAPSDSAAAEPPAAVAPQVQSEAVPQAQAEVVPQAQAEAVPQAQSPQSVIIGEGVVIGGGVLIEGKPAEQFNMAVVPQGLAAEDQTPTGKFTTAAEIRPILDATKGNWVAVREYNGQDLLYITHLWAWRCGLSAVAISLNDEPMQNWPLPPCHMKYSTPNAILEEDGLPYLTLKPGSVQRITIQVVYDDLTMDQASFARGDVLIP